mgnify:CR=1 FL=1
MEFTHTVEINAPRAQVWSTLADVERWTDWTQSITSIDLLDKPLASGGLALSRYSASAVLVVVMITCILLLPQRAASRSA